MGLVKLKPPSLNNWIIVLSYILLEGCLTKGINSPTPVYPIPTDTQIRWHQLEYYAFIHFSINTFTDKEWGYGDESPTLFDPDSLNIHQWVSLFKEVGMKAVIITAKHHDGFCLWPSKYTEHSIRNSPYKNGEGDIIRELTDACKEYGLKFGIYISPWDRNHEKYGSKEYITYYRNQMQEIFENYGPIFEMWFDGANGGDGYYGDSNEIRRIDGSTYYDWPTTIDMVRKLEPAILFFSDAGPEIRWVGNERGIAGATNWNMITPDTLFAGKPGITELLNRGSENGSDWIPAEVDVSIRPGWFYHESQDEKVKTAEDLFKIYLTSVGRGSNLLLNIPPNKHGLISETDIKSLRGLKELIDKRFKNNVAREANIVASNTRGGTSRFGPINLIDGNPDTYWTTDEDITSAILEIKLPKITEINYLVLHEPIQLGQRIKKFSVEVQEGQSWHEIASETTIGYKRIFQFDNIKTERLRIKITESRACPILNEIEIY